MLPTVLCLYPYNSERCRFSALWHKLGFITLMRIFLFTWDRHANYHLFSDSVTIVFSIGFVVREESIPSLEKKWLKQKSLIILVLRTWFILPFSSWTTEPGTSSPRWVPDSFCLHSSAWTTDPASQLPSSWPAPHSAVSGQICLALSMICEFPVHEPTCQIKPTPAPSRRAARIWKVPHSDLVTSLVDTHLLAGGSFSPGRSEGSSPLPKPCLLSVL